jgi:hypothetical protein
MKLHQILALLLLSACQKQETVTYSMSQSDALAYSKALRGTIYSNEGDSGPFIFHSTAAAPPGSALEISANTKAGPHWISLPAKSGYFYEADSYENSDGGIFFVTREVPIKKKNTEQGAAANP